MMRGRWKCPPYGVGTMLGGVLAGVIVGGILATTGSRAAARKYDRLIDELDHDLRLPLTVIRGEIELVLGEKEVAQEERQRSAAAVVGQVERIEALLRARNR